ncbi:uncharacterized protein [Rutidosis leptorrhynchoides]|uniref:uncharacterized protein n=1 Tax=Rutidosis leptorrhynchoides TaxID=125765 RepID=UPI003A996043
MNLTMLLARSLTSLLGINVREAEDVVRDAWNVEVPSISRKDCIFRNKLKNVKNALKKWSSEKFHHLDEEIEIAKNTSMKLEIEAETRVLDDMERVVWRNARKEWLEKEGIKTSILKQKARIKWVTDGDENSKFFHSVIRRRNNTNSIRGLTINGTWNDSPSDIKDEVFNHYKNIFEATDVERPSLENLCYPSISPDVAAAIEEKFVEKEIHDAILDCGSTKAPGPDGFNLRFFKKFWNVIKGDLINAINWFWDKAEFSKGCNASFVTLVPKKKDPLCLGDFRPISLIGSYYKVIAKLLSNRLRKVIPSLVGPEQSAFLRGRFILDGALIVNECVDYLKNNRKKGLIFKVDFEKAFDCLNWEFLLEVMKSMGFGDKWRNWIFNCLSSASISVLVNGSPTKEFSLGRGVRQGDPLSPFLFILAAEGLNIMAKSAIDNGLFNGLKVGNDEITISHLQYADDTIFLGDWSHANACSLQNLLKCFELASGLKVNFQKSCLFGIGVSSTEANYLANILGCKVGQLPFTYLGLPIGSKMRRVKDWVTVIDKFKSKLDCWKMRSMSFGGRVTLIKSVLTSLPLYFFSLYRAPRCVLNILESVRRNFFWGGIDFGSKINWVKWDDVITSYGEGGLNIGSLLSKNLALLGKWWWRFKTETNALWVKVIRSVYGSCGGLEAGADFGHSSPRSTWTNILLAGKQIDELNISFSKSFSKILGDGSSTSFWHDVWIGDDKLCNRFQRLYRLEVSKDAAVCDRISVEGDSVNHNWNWIRVPTGRTFDEWQAVLELTSRVKLDPNSEDKWAWSLNSDNRLTVKSLAALIDDQVLAVNNVAGETMRNRLVPKKIEIFTWRVCKKRIPVKTELDKRGIDLHSIRCPICDESLETIDHALIFCKQSMDLWSRIFRWWGFGNFSNLSGNEILRGNGPTQSSRYGKLIWQAVEWVTTYHIWKNRNNKVFNDKIWNVPVAFNEIQTKSFEWIANRAKPKHKIEWLDWINNPSVYLNETLKI